VRNEFVRPVPRPETRKSARRKEKRAKTTRHLLVVTSVGAGGTVLALLAGLVLGGGDSTASAGPATANGDTVASPTPTPAATLTPSAGTADEPAPEAASGPATSGVATPIIRSTVAAEDGAAAGPVTGGTTVTLTGTDLTAVGSATFGDNLAEIISATPDTLTLHTPAASDLDPGAVPVTVFTATGELVPVAVRTEITPEAPAAAAADALSQAVEGTAGPTAVAADPAAETAAVAPALAFTYVPDPRITAQIDYVLAHWQDYNTADFGVIRGNDCVNFTSQSLLARGWAMDADWSYTAGKHSTAWASSTAFAAYLAAHPERATPLADDQRADVKVGDIVQFDWDRSGDRDHTGIVTRVEATDSGVEIFYAGHTMDTQYHSVDTSLANTGGTVSYWSVV
jgi:hypothetical protein